MFEKVAIVGDENIVFAFRALGIKVFSPKSIEEAKEIMETLEKENFALCLLHQSFLEPLKKERKELEKKFCPVVVGFNDYREVPDQIKSIMKETAIKATGSDSLMRRKEGDERR
ncbi:MAG: V-type ATP synthase subunit F [Candidatus Aminicenantaceae bacterium]